MSRLTDEQMIQVMINTAVAEALSANNAKWREILNSLDVHENELGYVEISNHVEYDYYKNLLSEMGKEGE